MFFCNANPKDSTDYGIDHTPEARQGNTVFDDSNLY